MKGNSPHTQLNEILAAVIAGDEEAAEKLKREFDSGPNVLKLSDDPSLTPHQRMLFSLDDRTLQLVAPGRAEEIRQLRRERERSAFAEPPSPSVQSAGPKP